MKVAVKDIRPNPFHPNLPLNQSKIKQLEANIKSTGFWDNILLRSFNGGYECAYGHHRLQAVKNVGIKEIDVPVKDLDDATMLQVMAQENMEEMEGSPIWAMEVVKVTFNFLKEQRNLLHSDGEQDFSLAIAKFLSWSPHRVQDAYANLRATGEIKKLSEKDTKEIIPIKKEIFEKLPSQAHATEFRKAVKRTGASPKAQRIAAPKFAKESAKPEEAERIISETQQLLGEKKKEPLKPKSLPDINDFARQLIGDIDSVNTRLTKLNEHMVDLSSIYKRHLLRALTNFNKLIQEVLDEKKDEKN